jgi:hypothetical protein
MNTSTAILGTMLDASGKPLYRAVIDNADGQGETSHTITFNVLEACGEEMDGTPLWEDFDGNPYHVARFYVKWDGCAHVGCHLGTDQTKPGTVPGWEHVCGPEQMQRTLAMLGWAWNLAMDVLREKGHDEPDFISNVTVVPLEIPNRGTP